MLLAGCAVSAMATAVWLVRQPGFLPYGPLALATLAVSVLSMIASGGWLIHRRGLQRLALRMRHESDARRDRILQGTNDGWWDLDLSGTSVFVSERWRQMHGLGMHDALPQTWQEIIHPADRARVVGEFTASLRDPACLFHEMEYRCVLADGRTIWVLARGFFERDASGRARRMSGSTSDITRSKRAETEREAAHDLIRGIAEHVPGMVYQYRQRTDGSSHFPYASPAIEAILGVTPEHAARDASFLLEALYPEDVAPWIESVQKSARELSLWQHEFRIQLPDGGSRWLLGHARPEGAADGSTVWNGFLTDVGHRKHQELALQDALRQSQAILDNMVDGMITIDERGRIASFNQAASRIFGYAAEEVMGLNVSMLMPEPHRSHHDRYLSHYQGGGEARVIGIGRDVEGLRKDGRTFPMRLSVSHTAQHGQPMYIGLVQDITQRKRDEEEIRRLAFYDPLTGLPNRRLLMDRLKQAMVTSARTNRHGAVMFLDLDNFKLLNDSLGHDVGDQLLQQVGDRLRYCVRDGDTVARLGGDEFVVLLENLSLRAAEAANQTETVALKILQALDTPYPLGTLQHRSTPSIGIVVFLRDAVTMEDLLKMADVAMYQAKAAGRNTTRFFDPVLQAEVAARAALEADLRLSLRDRDFLLLYQPQADRQGDIVGVEALVRWQHPTRGMVSPCAFIPLAEETGLVLPLGTWVLEAACEQLVAWSRQPAMSRCSVSVNVSAQQLAEPGFVDLVVATLGRTGARADRLKLELTESMLVDDVESVIAKMLALKALGVGFSLDDFGTGYSSLSYLKRLPLDQLKIDQSFVRDLLVNANASVIARTIIGLGHSLGLSVIAEGVETEAQQRALWHSGCDAFQGYLLGRPAPAAALEERLHDMLAA
jgi:diguanylate cyclase (GGDEF)-like protein/PAS domain S-box-containing protein